MWCSLIEQGLKNGYHHQHAKEWLKYPYKDGNERYQWHSRISPTSIHSHTLAKSILFQINPSHPIQLYSETWNPVHLPGSIPLSFAKVSTRAHNQLKLCSWFHPICISPTALTTTTYHIMLIPQFYDNHNATTPLPPNSMLCKGLVTFISNTTYKFMLFQSFIAIPGVVSRVSVSNRAKVKITHNALLVVNSLLFNKSLRNHVIQHDWLTTLHEPELVSRPRPRTSNAPCLAKGNL